MEVRKAMCYLSLGGDRRLTQAEWSQFRIQWELLKFQQDSRKIEKLDVYFFPEAERGSKTWLFQQPRLLSLATGRPQPLIGLEHSFSELGYRNIRPAL